LQFQKYYATLASPNALLTRCKPSMQSAGGRCGSRRRWG
jgi:hypothetical protein